MQKQCQMKFFVKTNTNVIIFVQLFVDSVLLSDKQWLKDKESQFLLDSIKHAIHQEIEKHPSKAESKSSKQEWDFLQNDEIKIGYRFRKNHARDYVFFEDNVEGTGLQESSSVKFCTYPVFHERLTATVSKLENMITKKNEITDVSKYFTDPSTETTMSTERKKVSLSRIKMKMSLKEANESSSSNSELKDELSSMASVCKKFTYDRPSSKDRIATSSRMETEASGDFCYKQMDVLPEGRIDCKRGHRDSLNKAEKNDSDCTVAANSCIRNVDLEARSSMDDENDLVLVEDKRALMTKPLKGNMTKAGTDMLASDLDLSFEDFRTDLSRKNIIVNCSSDKQNDEPSRSSSTRTKDKRKLMEDGSTRSLRFSKRRKKKANVVLKEAEMEETADGDKEMQKSNLKLDAWKNSINIENYDEVCLDDVRSVKDMSATQIRSMVRNIERDIRDIFEGKVLSTRHQEYKKGGQSRAKLAFDFHYGEFSEEQQEAVTDTLRQLFCYKHSRYFDYILKVLVPETMMMISMTVEKHNENQRSRNLPTNT